MNSQQLLETKSKLLKVTTIERTLGFVVDNAPDAEPCLVENNLFVGSADSASNVEALERLKITHVLSVAADSYRMCPPNIVFLSVQILDRPDTDLISFLPKCFNFISNALTPCSTSAATTVATQTEKKVLVVCNAGISRSVSVVIAYLMYTRRIDFQTAFQIVKNARNCARPNEGFESQLKGWHAFNFPLRL